MSVVENIRHNTISTASYDAYHSYMTSAIPTDTERYVNINSEEINNIAIEEKGKYSIFDVANWFLMKGDMTHKKLQKLCYYAQAWAYALKGYRLEDTDYQAWVHGPVSPALWDRFKSFGYDTICLRGKCKVSFDDEDIQLLEDVEKCYSFLGSIGYRFIRLGFAKGNPQSEAFWRKNGFTRTRVEADNGNYVMVVMERGILLCRLLSFLSVCKVSAGIVPWRLHPKVFWLLSKKISLYGKFKSTLPSLKWK